jgi:hypothetical protein
MMIPIAETPDARPAMKKEAGPPDADDTIAKDTTPPMAIVTSATV